MEQKKTLLYVGGINHEMTTDVLYSAFIPFGDIVEVQIPPDPTDSIIIGGNGRV
jgi:peptidyl-prolyl isomerase E (cyclophilin E)